MWLQQYPVALKQPQHSQIMWTFLGNNWSWILDTFCTLAHLSYIGSKTAALWCTVSPWQQEFYTCFIFLDPSHRTGIVIWPKARAEPKRNVHFFLCGWVLKYNSRINNAQLHWLQKCMAAKFILAPQTEIEKVLCYGEKQRQESIKEHIKSILHNTYLVHSCFWNSVIIGFPFKCSKF